MALKKLKQPVIRNSKGEPIVLTEKEKYHAAWTQKLVNERFGNALGYEVPITTLTTIVKKVSEQKFFEIAPSDYIPIRVGEGSWSSNLTTYRSFDVGDIFESGIINTGSTNTRLSVSEAGVDALNIKVYNWAKAIGWSIFELQEAAKSGNWDLVTAKEESRKRNWDLGIQRVAFLGARGSNSTTGTCLGLLNQVGITFNTTLITAELNTLTPAQLSTFQQLSIQAYRKNCNYTAFPTHFIVPESDYNGMVAQASPTYPMKSILELLEAGFKTITRNPNFKILPLAYADVANAGGSLNSLAATAQYAFLNYDDKSLRMDIPVDYTNTLANSIDNFNFSNAGYGQFTGALAYRPAELFYCGF